MILWLILLYSVLRYLNPLNLVILILVFRLVVSWTRLMFFNKWVFFSLVLFYIGGLIILFIYLVSLLRSEKVKPVFFKEVLLILGLVRYIRWENFFRFMDKKMIIREILVTLYQLFPILGVVLLIALFTVVKISCSWLGPLKSQIHE